MGSGVRRVTIRYGFVMRGNHGEIDVDGRSESFDFTNPIALRYFVSQLHQKLLPLARKIGDEHALEDLKQAEVAGRFDTST